LSELIALGQLPVILNGGLYADDWLSFILKPGYSVDLDFLLASGHPFEFFLFNLANATRSPIAVMQVLTFASILAGALALRSITQRLQELTSLESVSFALMAFIYPGYQLWAGKGTASYVICYGMFFVAARLWLAALENPAKRLYFAARMSALALFFVSFSLNSLMIVYAMMLPAIVILHPLTRSPERSWPVQFIRAVGLLIRRYPDFLVLPVAFWWLLNVYFPRSGAYQNYYRLRFPDLAAWLHGFGEFARWGIVERFNEALTLLHSGRLVLAVGLLLACALLPLARPHASWTRSELIIPIVAFPVTFIAEATPYLLINVAPSAHFYETRHLLLFGLPAGFFVIALKRLCDNTLGWRLGAIVLSLSIGLALASLWNVHAFLQARWIEQLAIIHDLKKDWPVPPALVFNLADEFEDAGQRYVYFGMFEVTGMLHLAWDDQPFVGFSRRHESPLFLKLIQKALANSRTSARKMRPDGAQATIIVQPGPARFSNLAMALHYYACHLSPSCDVGAFLDGVLTTRVVIGPISGVEPPQ
jgi:hypothetical protein